MSESSQVFVFQNHVTQAEWEALMGYNPSSVKDAERPVDNITWHEAITFCNKLSVRDGFDIVYKNNFVNDMSAKGYRLPTEIEWEAAFNLNTTQFYDWCTDIWKQTADAIDLFDLHTSDHRVIKRELFTRDFNNVNSKRANLSFRVCRLL